MNTIALICALFVAGTQAATDPWGYHHPDSVPEADWGDVDAICASGTRQSPIDLKTPTYDDTLAELGLEGYDSTASLALELSNNGHSAVVSISGAEPLLALDSSGTKYKLAQFHFHWGSDDGKGSEHTVNGNAYPLELHLVHYKNTYADLSSALGDGEGLAVLGIFYELSSSDNAEMAEMINKLAEVTVRDEATALTAFELEDLLPDDIGDYYRYMGSLTTPPCSEAVVWTVFKETQKISATQVAKFRELFEGIDGSNANNVTALVDNWRAVQDLNGRTIYSSFDMDGDDGTGLAVRPYPTIALLLAVMAAYIM